MDIRGTSYSPVTLLWLASASLLLGYAASVTLISFFSKPARYFRNSEWAYDKTGWLSGFWASIDSLKRQRPMLQHGYTKFSKQNRPFAIPQFGGEPILMLPPTKMDNMLQQAEQDVDLKAMLQEFLAAKYTGDEDIASEPHHLDVVKHELTRKLPMLAPDVYSELLLGFADRWKIKKDGWTAVPAFQPAVNIISRAANRVFCGTELCRNEEFLEHTRAYAQDTFEAAALINLTPFLLKPVVAAFLTRKLKSHVRICQRLANPVIERRRQAIKAGNKDPPTDCLQWMLEKDMRSRLNEDANTLTRRLIRLNMVAIHTTSITITHTILDLFSHSRRDEFVESLREEVDRVSKAHGGLGSKAAVNDLYRIDSAIKESMRWTSISSTGVFRLVTAKNGIDLGDGIHIPQGVRTAMPNFGIHHDPQNYDHPDEYDAFRFSRQRETLQQDGQTLQERNQAVVTTSDTFLTFGRGKHACPGRFFASQEMKLMLAHIIQTYDVKIDGPRPQNVELKGASVPSPDAMLQVRWRQT